ncbi:hypothetical protein [Flindersiella endophytica]
MKQAPGALGAFGCGGLLVAAGICQLANAAQALADLLLAAGLLVGLIGVAGIHRHYRAAYGRLGLLGAAATGAGQLLQAASAVAGVLTGDSSQGLALLLFVAGSVLFLPGLLVLTVAVFRAGTGHRWIGPVLVAGVVTSGVVRDYGGTAAFGAAWIVVGVLLLTDRRRSAGGPGAQR